MRINSFFKRWGTATALVLALGAVVWAAQIQVNFRDRGGDLEIRGGVSFAIDALTEGRFAFEGRGKPIVAEWKLSGRRLQAAALKGVLSRGADRRTALVSATLSGGVEVTLRRPSQVPTATQPQTLTLKGRTADFTAADEKWVISDGLQLDRVDAAAGQTTRLTGSKGTVWLVPPGTANAGVNPLKQVELEGPITFEFSGPVGQRTGSGPGALSGSADRLTYVRETGKVVLTGNVRLTGSATGLDGELTAASATATLDAQGNVLRLELSGDPGVARLSTGGPAPR